MNKKMKAAVMTETGRIEFMEREIPEPTDNEVLVKIRHVGLCGSDIHYYQHGRIGDFVVKDPMVLGHESAGEVVKAGSKVRDFNEGDLVTLEPGIPCRRCSYCKTGRYNLCADMMFMATPPYDGAFVEYVAYPSDMTYRLPDGMGTIEGALIEPLAVAFHAVKQSEAQLGMSAVVLGCGCIGLVTLMTLKAVGITRIFAVDLVQKRLGMAHNLGASEVIKADDADVAQRVMEITDGQGTDLVFETAGSSTATRQTVDLIKKGGTIVLVGMVPDGPVPFDMCRLISKEASIKTVFRYRNLYPDAIGSVANGLIPLKQIVTHRFGFKEVEEAVKYNIDHKDDVVKTVIEM